MNPEDRKKLEGQLSRRPEYFDPWYMTEEAKNKVKELQSEWGDIKTPTIKGITEEDLKKMVSELEINHTAGIIRHEPTVEKVKRQQYIGQKKVKDAFKQQIISLEEYVQDLSEFDLVDTVYVLADDREEDETVSVLIKFISLADIKDDSLLSRNIILTNYLQSTGIKGAKHIEVSFQYKEVF